MTRNVMFCFLQNLTTSRKQQQQLQGSSSSSKISDGTMFGASKAKSGQKTKLKCEIANADDSFSKIHTVNGKVKKKSSKSKFFLRKSRWVQYLVQIFYLTLKFIQSVQDLNLFNQFKLIYTNGFRISKRKLNKCELQILTSNNIASTSEYWKRKKSEIYFRLIGCFNAMKYFKYKSCISDIHRIISLFKIFIY